MENGKKYYAFISYKREDEEWAKWLQHKLEHYKLPANLNGRTDLPKEIRPVFKDTSELNPGNLPQQIHDALEQSKHLIVICSPHSARSEWVNKEVETFIGMGWTDRIIPFIIDGKAFAKNPEEECFPEAIRNLPSEQEILGANISEMGRDAAAVKVVAQMFGLRFDSLWQRYEREKKRKRRLVYTVIMAFALVALGIAGWMWHQNLRIKEIQSRLVAQEALKLDVDGYSDEAKQLLMEVLPDNRLRSYRPNTSEVEFALRKLWGAPSWNNNFRKHSKSITSICYSPDGKYILTTAVDDSLVFIWDAEKGACLDSLVGHTSSINNVSFSNDGKLIVSSSSDGTFRLWNANTFRCVKTIINYANARNASFNIDGTAFIANTPPTLRDTSGTTLRKFGGHAEYAAMNQKGNLAVTAYKNGDICLWDVESSVCFDTLEGHTGCVKSVMFSNNDSLLVSAATDSTIRIWNVTKRTCVHTITCKSMVRHAEFSFDDALIVSASEDSTCGVWNAVTGALFQAIKQRHKVCFVTFHPNKSEIACGLSNGNVKTFDLFDKEDLRYSYKMPMRGYGTQILGFVNENKQMAVLFPKSSLPATLAASFDIDTTSRIEFFDVETGAYMEQNRIVLEDTIKSISIVKKSKLQDNMITREFPDFRPANNVPYGQRFHTVEYATTTGKVVLYGINAGANFVSVSKGGDMELYDVHPWRIKKVTSIYNDHPTQNYVFRNRSDVNKMFQTISVSKHYLLVAIKNMVYVWNVGSGRLVYEKAIESRIITAAFTPDEKNIIAINSDGYLVTWDFPPLQVLVDIVREQYKQQLLTPKERRRYYLE